MQSGTGAYHWRNGWFFKRTEDGSVQISKKSEDVPFDNQPAIPMMVIPSNEWASIVASVTASGENSETYQKAEELHAT